jgi:RimJ/RimL family protein N-acetyltransferase
MTVPLPILTERLLIRQFDPEVDVEAAVSVYCDAEVMRYVTGGPLSDEEAVRGALEKYVRAQQEYGFSSWAVVERETGRVIGDVGFGIFEPTNEVELGYTLAREFWGRGYATEAAGSCLSAGLAHLDVPRIIAVVDAENQASLRVAEHVGMASVKTIAVHHRPHLLFEAHASRRKI